MNETERAIEILKTMIKENMEFMEIEEDEDATAICEAENWASSIALQALREKQARENPKPLTLDELRQRNGKPVWCQEQNSIYPCREWGIVHSLEPFGDFAIFGTHLSFETVMYGAWLAYDYPPKEAEE